MGRLSNKPSKAILQALEDIDMNGFRLNVDHLNIPKFFKMIYKGVPRDDLEQVIIEEPLIPDDSYPDSVIPIVSPTNMYAENAYEKMVVLDVSKQQRDIFYKKHKK